MHDEYVAILVHARSTASEEEAGRLSKVLAMEDEGVFRKKKLASRLMAKHSEVGAGETKPAEISAEGKGGQNREVHKDETGKSLQGAGEGIGAGKVEAHEGKVDAVATETNSLMKLNQLMVQTLKLQAAPKVEIGVFRGDPLEYSY